MSFYVSANAKNNDNEEKNPVISLFLFKILTNHLQYLWIMLEFPFPRQKIIDNVLNMFLKIVPNPSEGISMECFFKKEDFKIGNYYYKVLIISIFPLVIVITTFIYLKIYFKNKENLERIRKLNLKFSSTIWSISLIIFFMLYSNMIRTCLESFLCQDVGDFRLGKIYILVKDVKSKCYNSEHITWIICLIGPMILLNGILLPAKVISILSKVKKNESFDQKVNLFKYGFFYFGYKKNCYYWEMIIQLRKLLLIILNIAFTTFSYFNSIYQISLYIFYIQIWIIINLIVKPYKNEYKPLLNIENMSFYCLLANFYLILFALPKNDVDIDKNQREIISLFGILINLFFLIPWLRLFLKFNILIMLKQVKKAWIKTKNYINKSFFKGSKGRKRKAFNFGKSSKVSPEKKKNKLNFVKKNLVENSTLEETSEKK